MRQAHSSTVSHQCELVRAEYRAQPAVAKKTAACNTAIRRWVASGSAFAIIESRCNGEGVHR